MIESDWFAYLDKAAIAIFSITGVLAATRKNRDIFGLVVLGVITAIGGGTIRDIIIDARIFWLEDFSIIIVAIIAACIMFVILKKGRVTRDTYTLLLYFDALGVAFFGIQGLEKTLAHGYESPIAVLMGMLSGLGGGVIRDILSGRPNLLITTELYASPALMGCILYIVIRIFSHNLLVAHIVSIVFIFVFRSLAIYFNWHMPAWLINRRDNDIHRS